MSRFQQIDLKKVRLVSLRRRQSKTEIGNFGKALNMKGADRFFASLPRFLKAAELQEFLKAVAVSRRKGRPFHLMLGAHVIKVGLSDLIIDLMNRQIVTGLSFNSAGLIHDLELAFGGRTSEDVAAGLRDGSFGMAKETGRMYAEIIRLAIEDERGLGEAAGRFLNRPRFRFRKHSLFAAAERLSLPTTVHLGIGTDIVQQHPVFDAAAAGEASYRDFKILAHILLSADRGGVVANIGSAVILPEVFLKALTVARNIGKHTPHITTANFDMINHYRPAMNIVRRPTEIGGKGYNFIGHHEIMVPLMAWGLKSFVRVTK